MIRTSKASFINFLLHFFFSNPLSALSHDGWVEISPTIVRKTPGCNPRPHSRQPLQRA